MGRIFEELDYEREAAHAQRFRALYDTRHGLGRGRPVRVPRVYPELSSTHVLTMEWMEGVRLNDAASLRAQDLDAGQLVKAGVVCSLRQLLEEGFFHADPHPGNLMVTVTGELVYLDFGMCREISAEDRQGLIKVLVNFVNRWAAITVITAITVSWMLRS